VILEDLVTGAKMNLSATNTYTCYISDTTSAPRFRIHVSPSHKIKTIAEKCKNFSDGIAIAIAAGSGPWKYTWMDSLNQVIRDVQTNNSTDTLQNLTGGNYFLKVLSNAGMCLTTPVLATVPKPLTLLAVFTALQDTILSTDSIYINNTSVGGQKYTWDFGDGSTDTSASPRAHLYNAPGKYTIKLTVRNLNCVDSSFVNVLVRDPFAVNLEEDLMNESIEIFPNPNAGKFQIRKRINSTHEELFSLYDSQGRLVLKEKINSPATSINISNEAKGIYFLRIESDEVETFSTKIIVQ
jgi:hypothetical protein